MTELFLIWSIEHNAWWRHEENGYTSSHEFAGRYSKSEAYRISARCNYGRLDEVPVPASFFDYQEKLHTELKTK